MSNSNLKLDVYFDSKPCGCGKTTFISNLILKEWVDYYRIIIFAKTLSQPIYTSMLESKAVV